ncbi:hypothetical protein TNCV_547691 [Trichonephila clavipes]|nr:hypothetical protein TNCV_547691 [Trichonephila clavipes]
MHTVCIHIRPCLCLGLYLFGWTPDLYVFSHGNINVQTYRDGILKAYLLPYVGAICDAFVLQDDNMRPHRSPIVDAYLEQESIQRTQELVRS